LRGDERRVRQGADYSSGFICQSGLGGGPQPAIERVARLATSQAERLADTNRQQEEVQQRLAVNLQRYQQIFHEVEQAGSKLLEQIEQHLRRYMATTQQGFAHLTETADEHFANASRRLGDTVNELDEHLQDLTDILERLGRVGGGNGRA